MDNVPAIVATLDMQGKIGRFNKFAQQLTGYTEDEVRGKSWIDIFNPPDDRESIGNVQQEVFGGRPLRGFETRILARDGQEILTQWHASPLHDDSGDTVGGVGIGIDVTDLRQKEDQLRQAAKMEAIGRLAGGVAHDFNNYLMTIEGYSELLLQSQAIAEDSRHNIEQISKAAEKAAQLTKQLLAFGRKSVVRPRVININHTLNDMVVSVKQMLGESIHLVMQQMPDLGNVKADPGQIQQIIINLVINARDAMPGGGRLVIATANVALSAAQADKHPKVTAGPYVVLSVRDNGKGMDNETLGRIFEPFFTTKPDTGGTGLGLATAYGIAEQNGGYMTADSSPSLGTTFKVFIPRVDDPVEAIDTQAEQPASDEAVPGGTETILVVEDEEPVRKLLVRILKEAGYTTLDTGSPGEAILKVLNYKEPIHLLISDVIMPEMSGPERAVKLRLLRPGLPVLYTSGYTRDALPTHDTLEPGTSLLSKPFTADDLRQRIRQVLATSRED